MIDQIIYDEHLLKISRREKIKFWLHHCRNHKRIKIWISKEVEE